MGSHLMGYPGACGELEPLPASLGKGVLCVLHLGCAVSHCAPCMVYGNSGGADKDALG